jgi:hypothetical protein
MYLEGVRKISINKKDLELYYFITEIDQYIADRLIPIYGIKIVNKIKEEEKIHYEIETVKKLSYSKDLVQRLSEKLMKHLITPLCMIEIIDELMSELELSS